ncbi:hypothetical protein NIIDMKKI_64950 [Mycobacterium kansasii]|uniref:Uncharacterized protein n=1 Tax=Mycobacterium kansasii TaxID=1768 RepID=A0A7G1IN65_MYCKA|nr:hypothetical protein NIIDMKKI_64950 [Mycobacterium kansasii]
MQQLGAQRLGESVDRVFGPAVDGLQRNRAVAQRRPDLNDRAPIAGPHAAQRRHGAPDEAQISHVRRATVFVGSDLVERGEHRSERHIDPYVDPTESALHLLGRGIDLVEAGDVGRYRQGLPAGLLHLRRRRIQPGLAAGQQPYSGTVFAELAGGRAADSGAGSGDDHRRRGL